MALSDALKAVNDAVQDLTSLHVQTFTGQLGIPIDDQQGFKDIRVAVEEAKAAGTITVVADSLIQFDGDSYNFVAADAPSAILKAHESAVLAGLKSRQALLELGREALGL